MLENKSVKLRVLSAMAHGNLRELEDQLDHEENEKRWSCQSRDEYFAELWQKCKVLFGNKILNR